MSLYVSFYTPKIKRSHMSLDINDFLFYVNPSISTLLPTRQTILLYSIYSNTTYLKRDIRCGTKPVDKQLAHCTKVEFMKNNYIHVRCWGWNQYYKTHTLGSNWWSSSSDCVIFGLWPMDTCLTKLSCKMKKKIKKYQGWSIKEILK